MTVNGGETDEVLLDKILWACISEIWFKYDEDRSGTLDKKEIKRFILSVITEMSDRVFSTEESLEEHFQEYFTNEDYDKCFAKIDIDDSGTITKYEMLKFVKMLAHF